MASPARTLDALSDAIKGDVNRISDPGNGGTINPTITPAYCELVTGSAHTRTLAHPLYAGMELTLVVKTDGGACDVTGLSPINAAGQSTAVMNDVGDTAIFRSIQVGSNYRWRVIGSDGVTFA